MKSCVFYFVVHFLMLVSTWSRFGLEQISETKGFDTKFKAPRSDRLIPKLTLRSRKTSLETLILRPTLLSMTKYKIIYLSNPQ